LAEEPGDRLPSGLRFAFDLGFHGFGLGDQLGVFLRLAGAKVPAVYQDSADASGGIFTGG